MKYKPNILPLAKADIREAALWYNRRKNGLGKQFTAEVRKQVRAICANPLAISVKYDIVRAVVTDIFPYRIHFVIDEPTSMIIVTAVLHTSRSPTNWDRPQV